LLFVGCGEEGTPAPNIDPETTISGSIPPEAGRAAHHVQFFWSGGDLDGTIAGYDYIVDTYARSVAQYSAIQPLEPQINDARWTRHSGTNIKLVVAADTLRADPSGDIGDGTFDRWHTFWVRSIDNEGAADQSPAKVTFQAFTIAPEMFLTVPIVIDAVPVLPKTFVVNWFGGDDIGTGTFQDPQETRWLLKSVQLDAGGKPIGYPEALYTLAESEWSAWAEWDAADSTGQEAVFFDQLPVGAVDTAFLFAVQGRDDGGAITPKFSIDKIAGNNYGVFLLSNSVPTGPSLQVNRVVSPDSIISWDFEGSAATPVLEMVSAGAVNVTWGLMQTKHYGANPGEYRFGWNIADPQNDDLWSAWSSVRVSPSQTLLLPVEELQIQARDNIGQVTTAVLRFQKTP
jgi:hypothetical protein